MPMRTALVATEDLDNDGKLEVREIFELDLHRCRMAVLSARETQLGRWSKGDEVVGLTRAFLRAGVPTVVASLWQVRDKPTFLIMTRFHELAEQPGTSRLEALAQAQRDFIAGRLERVELTEAEQKLLLESGSETLLASRGTIRQRKAAPVDETNPTDRPHPYYWAAFELLGDWR
jgi:CHAT domain-containing protein